MSTHKHIDRICLVAAILSLILCAVLMNGEALGIQAASRVMGYEERLFDTTKVHTIDIVIDDWEGFLETARSEEYSVCSVVIDGETISNVGIRGKGNTSLSTVASMDSDRYSFKIEFDQYDSTKTYHGLDKLSLNNIIQDNTYMKDYLSYQMMNQFDVPSPLCSYAWITVNGEDWGLYLAVEAVEEAFLQRNYGSDYGELYKPDSMNMGGGRGNGRDFDMDEFMGRQENAGAEESEDDTRGDGNRGNMPMQGEDAAFGGAEAGGMPAPGNMPGGFGRGGFSLDEDAIRAAFEDLGLDTSVLDGVDFENISMETIRSILSGLDEQTMQELMDALMDGGGMPDMGGGFGGSTQTKLQYTDDDPDSYSTIFESAKTDVTQADQKRLIASLKQLSEYEDLEEVLIIEDVLRYFVVHNYVVNGDSYTGNMIHNYYLYEEDGRLSMIPWDYNLAFGTFQGRNASTSVNEDIDEVLSDRPMQAWIFSDEVYSQRYYELYAQLLEQVDVQDIIDQAYALIAPYVEKDPTAFCTYEEFQSGVETLKEFCALRTESIRQQLAGSDEAVDAGDLNLSAMGSMMNGMGGFGGRDGRGDLTDGDFRGSGSNNSAFMPNAAPQFEGQNAVVPGGVQPPESGDTQLPAAVEVPEDTQPGIMDMPEGMQMPGRAEMLEEMQNPDETTSTGDPGSAVRGESAGNNSDQEKDTTAEGPSQVAPSNGMGGFEGFSPPGGMPDFGNMGGFGDRTQSAQATDSSEAALVLLAVSAVVLAAGLLVAFKFRR